MSASWSRTDGPSFEIHCRDISLGGCFLEADSPPPLGTVVLVRLDLPGLRNPAGKPVAAVLRSRVRWTTPEGMGVQFDMMGARETAALVELLAVGARAKVA